MDFFQSEGILDEATLGVVTIALSQIAKSYVEQIIKKLNESK